MGDTEAVATVESVTVKEAELITAEQIIPEPAEQASVGSVPKEVAAPLVEEIDIKDNFKDKIKQEKKQKRQQRQKRKSESERKSECEKDIVDSTVTDVIKSDTQLKPNENQEVVEVIEVEGALQQQPSDISEVTLAEVTTAT